MITLSSFRYKYLIFRNVKMEQRDRRVGGIVRRSRPKEIVKTRIIAKILMSYAVFPEFLIQWWLLLGRTMFDGLGLRFPFSVKHLSWNTKRALNTVLYDLTPSPSFWKLHVHQTWVRSSVYFVSVFTVSTMALNYVIFTS